MRRLTLYLAILSAAASAAGEGLPESDTPRTSIRSQILAEFRYAPGPRETLATSPFLAPGVVAPPEPASPTPLDVVALATYTVHETVTSNRITTALLQQKEAAQTAAVMDRLGIGIHKVAVGKFCLYAGTICYVPFTAGVAVSW